MRILGIETSCDETAAAIVEDRGRVLANVVSSQVDLHRPFFGVVPELASRAHVEKIPLVISRVLKGKGVAPIYSRKGNGIFYPFDLRRAGVSAIAFTRGPGLAGALLVGRVAAEALGYAFGLPVFGVNHIEGHIFSVELGGDGVTHRCRLRFPFVALVVSGGHTHIVLVRGYGRYQVLGRTRDDAAGEAFDKLAKLLMLEYPGGPVVDRLSRGGDASALEFPRPFLKGSWDFSFSGLKTAVIYHLLERGHLRVMKSGRRRRFALRRRLSRKNLADLCAGFQESIVDTLVEKALDAARAFKVRTVVVAGGVAANRRLREKFPAKAALEGVEVFFPRAEYCTDNGAMIAQVAYHRLRRGKVPYQEHQSSDVDVPDIRRRTDVPDIRRRTDPALPLESWNG